MSEEYIYPCGTSSDDVETCDECYSNFVFGELEEYRGEKFCSDCMEVIGADIAMDEAKDERFERD